MEKAQLPVKTSPDHRAAAFISRVMGHGWTRPALGEGIDADASVAAARAYELLFQGSFDAAVAQVREPRESSPYLVAVRRQVEALCTGVVTSGLSVDDFDVATLEGGMAVFHTAEAAHVVGEIAACDQLLEDALERGIAHPGPRLWNRLALVRLLLYSGDFARSAAHLELAWADVQANPGIGPLASRSVQAMRAQLAGVQGEPSGVIALAEGLRLAITEPATYADSGILLSASLGLAACGLPQAASELLRYGAGGPGLPLLPLSLRAYGYEVLIEAAVAAGNSELATWMMLDFDKLDLGGNRQMEAARETSRARVMISSGQREAGASHAWEATASALATGSAFFGARAAVTAALASEPGVGGVGAGGGAGAGGVGAGAGVDAEAVARLIASVSSADLRAWMTRALESAGRRARPLPGVGWDQLTATQHVVARLAARGLRNHEIAKLLVVSPRTVETHMAAILSTLGVESRVGIVATDARAGELHAEALALLTPRQRDVALGLVRGESNAQIAAGIGVTAKAVEGHVHRIFERLGVQSRAAVAAVLLRVHE